MVRSALEAHPGILTSPRPFPALREIEDSLQFEKLCSRNSELLLDPERKRGGEPVPSFEEPCERLSSDGKLLRRLDPIDPSWCEQMTFEPCAGMGDCLLRVIENFES
ncbi:hypothetical protein GCM10011371_08460 [Novosphingobium marinum]|uniref:Uncharacterized protein n=1 Tax=Novosphingobium marinum TaxID=1514948 RepID=A0A7Z0BSV3_9SPHN|nr:hypothetical protein [Novosphingobium marinum]NYH94534.1 hypothetical protein [Novosphingobium marinum]GGC23063.1 hypothetical protein GCM10011371_08460 [Novosphingobium marinum]